MTNEHLTYSGHHVINENHESIGTVTDVLYDGSSDKPKWLVVKPGRLQAEHYVPIEGSYENDDGAVVVPFDKKWIKAAPTAGDHVMTSEVEQEAAEHYGVEA